MSSGKTTLSGLVKVHTVLHRCREVELTAARLYESLAVIHAPISEMASIWRKTAIEEHNHASQFDFAINNLEGSPLAVEIDLDLLDNAQKALTLLCEEVQTRPPKPVEALRAAIVTEKAMQQLHLNCVGVFRHSTLEKLYDGMMAADRDHVGTLERFLDKITGHTKTPAHLAPPGLRLGRPGWRSSQS